MGRQLILGVLVGVSLRRRENNIGLNSVVLMSLLIAKGAVSMTAQSSPGPTSTEA